MKFSREQYEEMAREWDKMSNLPESGEPWRLSQHRWDCVSTALKMAAGRADDVATKESAQ